MQHRTEHRSAWVLHGHTEQLELGSQRQALRSQLLVFRVELGGEGPMGVLVVLIRSQRGLSLPSELMPWVGS